MATQSLQDYSLQMLPQPRPVKTYLGGEAAKKKKPPDRGRLEREYFRPKQRRSDGPISKTLHVYRLRHSVTETEVRELFEPYGHVDSVILYRPQFAYVVFHWVVDAMEAKRELDLTKALADGSYINVLLKAVQFVREGGTTKATNGKMPYDKLRIDFCLLPVEYGGKPLPEPLPEPSIEQTSRETMKTIEVEDDFYDDSVFDTPEARRAILDDFYDDSVFECPCVLASLLK